MSATQELILLVSDTANTLFVFAGFTALEMKVFRAIKLPGNSYLFAHQDPPASKSTLAGIIPILNNAKRKAAIGIR